MREFLRHILSRPVSVGMACCAVAVGGLFALARLPLGLAPSLEFPALTIQMSWGGASAESVEKTVTAPIEEIATSLRGVRKVRSSSREGGARVSVEFDQRTDMDLIRFELNERLSLLAELLPHGASHPVVERYVPEDIEQLQGFLSYSFAGPLSRSALARLAGQEIIPRLMSILGVAQVTLQGGEEQVLRVELWPDKLAACGITTGDVTAALEACRPGVRNGSLLGPAGVEQISVAGNVVSLPELEDIPVRRAGLPAAIRLRDVGTITVVPSVPRELFRVNGKECLTLTITRDPASSLPGTARDVRSCLARLSPRLPPGVELLCELDRSRRMTDELALLYRDALLAIVLLWGILTLFLGTNRLPFALISSVLLSCAGTLLTLWILHVSLHLLTLAGLVLGMGRLLDDSIVVLENLRRWTLLETSKERIVEGTLEVLIPVVASTAATAGALVPVLFLPRDLQVYLQEFAVAVTVSLCVSLLVSFSVIPSAALQWRMKGTGILMDPGGRAASFYRRFLNVALRHRVVVVIVAVWMFGFPVWLLPARIESPSPAAMLYNETIGGAWCARARPVVNALLGGASYQFFRNVPHAEFFDPDNGTFLVLQVNFPQGTDIECADGVARALEQDLLSAGAPRLTTRVFNGALFLRVDFPDSMVSTPLPGALRSRCLRLAAQTGGAAVTVAGFGAGFSGGIDLQPAFTVRVHGYEYARVKQIAESLREKLLHNPRVISADINRSLGNWSRMQEIALTMDREAAASYGLAGHEIAAAVQSRTDVLPQRLPVKLQGIQLPCVVTVKGSDRFSVADLASVAVPGKKSATVPFRVLLGVQQRAAPSEIVREDQQYVRWVSFEYKGPYRHAEAFLKATVNAFPLPEGYRLDCAGTSSVSEKDRDALLKAALASLLVVFMVTASLYESWLNPCIIMLSVPLAYIGVFMAYVLNGVPFGRGGYLSAIFLTGIAVANAIVIVDFIARREGAGKRGAVTIVDASVCRLRPVLMTTLTTAGSLLPMLLGERNSVWYGLALGTFGGLVTSALLTLIVIPVVYAMAHRLPPGARG